MTLCYTGLSLLNDMEDLYAYIQKLCALSSEIRFFPIAAENQVFQDRVAELMLQLQENNYGIEFRDNSRAPGYPEGSVMLRIWSHVCEVERG